MSARRGLLPVARDLSALAALLSVGVVGFGRVFEGGDHLIAGALGIATGLAIGLIGARFRSSLLILAALTVAGYLLLGSAAAFRGTAIAGVIPTVDTVVGLLRGAVTSWKSLLTVEPPANGFPELLIVPFASALICAVVSASLALRLRRTGWALVPSAVLLLVSILFGTTTAVAPVTQALVFGLIAVVWCAWRRDADAPRAVPGSSESVTDSSSARQLRLRRVGSAVAVLAVAAVVTVGTAGAVAPDRTRSTLRDEIIPPFDLHDYPSPLASFRKIVRDQEDATLFTVSGLPEGARVRLATMDAFDGTVFNVAGGGGGSGSFARVGTAIVDEREGASATLHFEAGELTGVWLPDAGYANSIRFTGERARSLADSLHYNPETGVAVVTSRLVTGDTYTVTTTIPAVPSDMELAAATAASLSVPSPIDEPEAVATIASEAVGDTTTPIDQVRSIATTLSTQGFFSHGLEGELRSRPGHGSDRLQTLLASDQMIGDDEQYATAMALMVDEIGLPARVVMGFYPKPGTELDGTVAITGADVHAWVEVAFAGPGWVAFDPTPPEDQVPQDQTTKPKTQPKAQVLQPPPPPQEPALILPDAVEEDGVDDDPTPDLAWIGVALGVVGGSIGLATLLFGPALLIGLLKRRKRRARLESDRLADRISGGWEEVVDRATDLGTTLPRGATRLEHAERLATRHPNSAVTVLARRADATIFGPADPDELEVASFWAEADALVAEFHGSVSPLARLRARLSLRSLRPAWLIAAAATARRGTNRRSARNEDTDD